MTQHHGSPDDPSSATGEGVGAVAPLLPGAEAVLAPLARQDLVSFLLDLGTGRILAATQAAGPLAIVPGARVPERLMATAVRLARRTAAGFGTARLRLPGDLSPRTLRFASLALPSGPALLFADPTAFAATTPTATPAATAPTRPPAVPAALRPLLAQPLRVTWESDADGRICALSPLLAAALGSRAGSFRGASFAELEGDGHLERAGALIEAIASGESFTDRTARVPATGVESALDLRLGGAPLFDAERRLKGVRGFGIVTAAEAEAEAEALLPKPPAAIAQVTGFGRNVVPLRQGSLSPQESSAFREIARTLAAAIEDWPRIPPEPAPKVRHPSAFAQTPSDDLDPDDLDPDLDDPYLACPNPAGPRPLLSGEEAELLDKLPVSLLVQQDGALVHANRAFLSLTGWSGVDALAAAGGLERVLSREAGALHVLTPGGARRPVEVRLVAAPFLGRPALIHVIRTIDPAGDDREARAATRRAALDMVPWPVFLLETDGTIRLANAAAAERLGFTAHELAGEPFTTAVAPSDRAAAVAALDRVAGNGAAGQVPLALRNRTGAMLPGLAAMTRAGADDQLLCVVIGPAPAPEAAAHAAASDGDGSDLRVPEAPSSASPPSEAAPLETADRADLLAGLAGRLRAGIAGPMALLRDAPATALSDPLRRALGSLNATLDDLASLSDPPPAAAPETSDLSASARAAVAALMPEARRRRLALRLDDAGAVSARIGRVPLDGLLRMLVEEAVAASPAGAAVAVSVFAVDDPGRGRQAVVQLSDAGAGLDAMAAAAALDPLADLPAHDRFAAEGRPLRLARMARDARANGGALEIDLGLSGSGGGRMAGRGMIARLTLPA